MALDVIMKLSLILLPLIAITVACKITSKTPYQSSSEYAWGLGVGVSEVEIEPGIFKVTAAAYSRTSVSEMTEWVERRAEEICGGPAEVQMEMPLVAFHRASSSPAHPDRWISGVVKCPRNEELSK
jgi:hypothetical protein